MFKWWSKSKCINSMVIAKTVSRNVVYKAIKLVESIFERQSEMLIAAASTVASARFQEVAL